MQRFACAVRYFEERNGREFVRALDPIGLPLDVVYILGTQVKRNGIRLPCEMRTVGVCMLLLQEMLPGGANLKATPREVKTGSSTSSTVGFKLVERAKGGEEACIGQIESFCDLKSRRAASLHHCFRRPGLA